MFELQIRNASLSSASFNNVCVDLVLVHMSVMCMLNFMLWLDIDTHECMLKCMLKCFDLELLRMSCVLICIHFEVLVDTLIPP